MENREALLKAETDKLIEEGKKKGSLTQEEIMSRLEKIDATADEMEDVFKTIEAVVQVGETEDTGTICAPLARKEGTIIERMVDFEHGEEAITHYKLIIEANGHSLVSLKLETGRTHQIRIHMKYLGFPLIGDYLYNPDMEHMTRQALHSHHMEFAHPITGEWMSFTAPLPADMANVLKD